MAAGTVLYVLFPGLSNLSYPMFISIYLLAQFAGLLSHVPGGLGVFETVLILLLPPSLKPAEILGALVAYRVIYYLLPLLAAAVLLGAREVLEKKEELKRAAEIYGRWASSIVPTVLAITIFVGGAILLFSGATPSFRGRLDWLGDFLPLPVMEASHFLGSLTGVGLLILARGLQRRFDTAYVMTTALLGAGVAFSLLKGLDYEEAITLSVMLGALLPCHQYFYRKTSLMNEQFTPGWVAAVAIVILGSIWLGLFSYKHVEYSSDLWWRFSLTGHAPRFLRAAVGTVVLALMFAMIKLLHPAQPKPHLPDSKDIERAYDIARRFKKTYACFALLGDKAFLFNGKGNAFIMYGVAGRSWVALGDPVGPQEEWPELIWQFREMCDHYDGWTVFYKVEPENLPLYIDLGLTLLKFGEEAMVPLENFSLEGGARKGLRYTNRKLAKEGCSFEVVPAENVPPLLPELKNISDIWLREKNTREKGFSLGFFKEDYLKRFPVALVRKEGKTVGFANVLPGADKEELSIDLMRYLPEATPGVMEYLFIQLMLWGNHKGYRWFNLGMAPLSGLEARSLAPLWNRIAALIFRYGEHFYNFQGLRLYKQKFDPIWEPRYLASPGGMVLPRIFTNLASLTSSGFKGILLK